MDLVGVTEGLAGCGVEPQRSGLGDLAGERTLGIDLPLRTGAVLRLAEAAKQRGSQPDGFAVLPLIRIRGTGAA